MPGKQHHMQYFEKLEQVFSVSYKETPGSENKLAHFHDQYELLLSLSDHTVCSIDDKEYYVGKNTLLLFNNMDLHMYRPEKVNGENRRFVMFFNPLYISTLSSEDANLLDCFLYRPFDDSQLLYLTEEESNELQNYLRKIIHCQSMTQEEFYGRELLIRLLLAQILLQVNTLYRKKHNIKCDSTSETYQAVYGIISYIHTHYQDDLSLDLLANAFYISKYTLCEKFRTVAGITPNKYIVNCRIMKAKSLLQHGYSVDVACSESGFNDLSHFSRMFKRIIGKSPKQYQQSFRKQII